MSQIREYIIKGFKSKYPFKQEPRANRTILFEGTKEKLESLSDPLLPISSVIKDYKFRHGDKFIMVYKVK